MTDAKTMPLNNSTVINIIDGLSREVEKIKLRKFEIQLDESIVTDSVVVYVLCFRFTHHII